MYDNQKIWAGSRIFNFEDMFRRMIKKREKAERASAQAALDPLAKYTTIDEARELIRRGTEILRGHGIMRA